MENMRVNHLPSLTWNALHMNDSRVDSAVTAGEAYIEKNLSMGLEEGIRGEELPCFEKIKTGMGPDMDALRKEGSMEPVQVIVPAGVKEQVLRLHIQRKPGESAFLPVEIAAEEDSEITVFVDDTGVKEEAGGTLALQFRADVKKGAKVRLVQVQLLSSQEQKLNDVGVSCADEGRFETLQLFLGAGKTYAGCRADLAGKGSSMAADIGYLGRETQSYDFNYEAVHKGKKTRSDMTASGVLWDHASKLFRGTIDFRNGSAGSSGDEKEDVLLMDEGVVNRTIPLILCAEEDVEGNHGASIGKLDDELLFYLVSRGMSREEACKMVARARIDALSRRLGDEALSQQVQKYLEEVFHG